MWKQEILSVNFADKGRNAEGAFFFLMKVICKCRITWGERADKVVDKVSREGWAQGHKGKDSPRLDTSESGGKEGRKAECKCGTICRGGDGESGWSLGR